uniref:ITPR-interacting domain-containing protein n=1 Tax=Falco tinnunculus TaxID=100819 RepID=A0A8C4XR59_FALTI
MEGASLLSPSSWEKRRAWVRQSRCWRTTTVEEEAAAAMQDVPELQPPHLDDVFLEGWGGPGLQMGWGSLFAGSSHCNGTSFEDDLTLGAEGTSHLVMRLVPVGLSWGCPLPCSISEVLEWWQADAEEILYNLGFVQSEPGAVARIPARFFSAPSHAKGIDFQLFLKAQVQRMEMEDPCLMLASRFQQVQALAATADAFFCLYSYVSRTPVQRISPSHLSWAYPDVPDICITPNKPSTLSPVERLKKAVSTMCLYMSPRDEDSPRGTGRVPTVPTSQPSAMGKVVQEVLERVREERFRFDPAHVLKGWGRGGRTGTVQHERGAKGGPPMLPPPWLVQGVPVCSHQGGVDAPACCGAEQEPFPQPAPTGALVGAVWGRLERSCPHGRGSVGSPAAVVQGAGDALCLAGAAQVTMEDHRLDAAAPWVNATLSTTLGPLTPPASQMWVTPECSEGLRSEGDSSFGFGSWRTSSTRMAGSHGCRPDPLDPTGVHSPGSGTPRAGGHWTQWSRGRFQGGTPRDPGWQQGDSLGLQPTGKGPLLHCRSWQEPVDSFEMEEVRGDAQVMGAEGLGAGGGWEQRAAVQGAPSAGG